MQKPPALEPRKHESHSEIPEEEGIVLGAQIDFADPNSPLARYYMGNGHLAAAALFALLFVFLNFVPLRQTDVWGHLKFGQWIVDRGQLPSGNPFCPFLQESVPSNYYCWLGQVLFYAIYHLGEILAGGDALSRMEGGVDLLRFSHALLVVARLTLLLLAFGRLTGSIRLALLGTIVTVVINVGGHVVIARPQILGELCFAGLLLLLSKRPMTTRAVIGAAILMVAWANLHGSFVIGLAFAGILLAGKIVESIGQSGSQQTNKLWTDLDVRRLGFVLLASVAAITLLNPAGPWIWIQTLGMTQHPVVMQMDEWGPPRFFGHGVNGGWVYVVTLVVLIAAVAHARFRLTATQIGLIAVFGLQPLMHQRALVWWFVVLIWVVLSLLAQRCDGPVGRWAESRSEPNFRKTIVAAALIVVALLWSNLGFWLLDGRPAPLQRSVAEGTAWRLACQLRETAGTEKPWLPELDAWLKRNYDGGNFRGCVFTTETSGDYLVFALPEQMPVFMYAHVHLCPASHWQQVAAVRTGSPHWRKVLDRHKINLLVMEPELNERLRQLLYQDPDWQVVYDETDNAAIVDPRSRLLIAVRKKPLT